MEPHCPDMIETLLWLNPEVQSVPDPDAAVLARAVLLKTARHLPRTKPSHAKKNRQVRFFCSNLSASSMAVVNEIAAVAAANQLLGLSPGNRLRTVSDFKVRHVAPLIERMFGVHFPPLHRNGPDGRAIPTSRADSNRDELERAQDAIDFVADEVGPAPVD